MNSRKSVRIGTLEIGGDAPVRVESMLKTPLTDINGCISELEELSFHGCELARVSLPDAELAGNLKKLTTVSPLPLMADIHFNHQPALAAIAAGCPAIRINPGNMHDPCGLKEVLNAAGDCGAVIRIGANGGSLSERQLAEMQGDRGAALALAVDEQARLLLDNGFDDIIISAKSSDVLETVRANTLLAQRYAHPIHIGITEAGPGISGAIKSAAGISLLLAQGIGDTIRVSLTAPGTEEVKAGYHILRSLKLRGRGVDLISCPTCGRKRVNVTELVQIVEETLPHDLPDDFSVAVMGCEVNGPREAAHADFGIAGTAAGFVIFQKGRAIVSGEVKDMKKIIENTIKELRR